MELPSCLLLHPANTDRPVDARWRRVRDLAKRGKHPWDRWDDAWVRRGLLYLRRLRACGGDADRKRLAVRMPDIDAAYRLRVSPDKVARGTLEARLLAGQAVDQAAVRCGLTAEAVTAYLRLFFDVLGSLRARAYILAQAVGPKHFRGMTEDDPDVILRWAGFVMGLAVLEPLIRYYASGWSLPQRLDDLSRDELGELYAMVQMRLLVLSRVLPARRHRRALAVEGLAERLKVLLDSWPDGAAGPPLAGPPDALTPCRGNPIAAWRTGVLDTCLARAV